MSVVNSLVLIRHGESAWNRQNRFTGWVDVDLSEKGILEAKTAGQVLKQGGFKFDQAYTSILKRAIRTLWIVQDEMDCMWLPVNKTWRLNERHYGALQGLDKSETAAKYGEEQVKIWRRSFDTPPPLFSDEDFRRQCQELRFQNIAERDLPRGETLKTTIDRLLPYWFENIAPAIKMGQRIVIVAHGNSLRGLVQHLEKISATEIMELNIPTGIPLVYDLDVNLNVVAKRYLGDADEISRAQAAVANQGKSKH